MGTGRRDIDLARALALVHEHRVSAAVESVPVVRAAGRVLGGDVTMRGDHPPFDNSAMDGWAVRAADTPGTLARVGESSAGSPWDGTVGPGQAVVISTGAEIPSGADAVVPRERVAVDGDSVTVPPAEPGAFVRRRASDARTGDVLLPAGTRVAPHHVAALAAAGWAEVPAAASPRVALLISGDEIVPVGAPLRPGQVWDVNGQVLPALIAAAGAAVVGSGAVPDDAAATEAALAAALGSADLVVTSGGVSVGDHDHLRPALARLGVEEVFWGVEIRPGHPLYLGRRGDVRVLCLPGNPVSAVVCFTMFGRPLLGCADVWHDLPLGTGYRPGTARTDLIRCSLRDGALHPAARQASHNVTSLADATHIAAIPAGVGEVPAGTPVPALTLPGT
jgi:molybdopterin molybdotransferase